MSNIKTASQMIEEYKDLEWLTTGQIVAFTDSLTMHIRYVQEAGRKLGVAESQLEIHDWSKWTREEFPGYARQFFGGKSPLNAERIPDDFALAWLNHIHHGKHHWQHWIFPDGFTPKNSRVENGVVQMPTNYVVEMVADWMGASKAYTGSWDMTDWLLANLPKIKIHSQTATYLERVLTLNGACDYTMVFMTLRSHGAW